MLRPWKYFLFFLLCLVIALAVNLPIQQVLPRVKLPPTVQIAGVDGSVVRGSADEIVVERFPLRNIRYRFMPSCIALLKICYRINYEQGTMQVAYDLLNGDSEVNSARFEYPVTELARLVPNLLVQPVGQIELTIDDMTMVGGRPTGVDGKLIWRDLGVDDQGINLNVGDYQVEFIGNPQKYDFKLSDLDASLDVNGDGEISNAGQYRVDIRIESESVMEPQVKTVLELVAATVSYNKYRVQRSGRLPPNIARLLFP